MEKFRDMVIRGTHAACGPRAGALGRDVPSTDNRVLRHATLRAHGGALHAL
jgi:hypothetical protein